MTALGSQSKDEEADALLQRAIGIVEKALGPHHPELAVSLSNRAHVLQAQVTYLSLGGRRWDSLVIADIFLSSGFYPRKQMPR